jgi:prepilin-type N-terminal cleavage/methylation domain-containing protein
MLDDKGFSLIELIVSILIMSIMTGIIVMLISTSRTLYSEVNTEAVVQTETEAIRSFIGELALEARSCGSGSYTATNAEGESHTDYFVWFLAPDNDAAAGATSTDYYYYFLLREGDTDVVRYGRYSERVKVGESTQLNPVLLQGADSVFGGTYSFATLLETDTDTKIYDEDYALLAEHVTEMNCSSNNGLVTVNLTLNYNGVSYPKTLVFAGRNM